MADISNKKIIYLSPANHEKLYCIPNKNEKQQMELVAKQVQYILSEYDCDVYYPNVFSKDQTYLGRPQEAQKLKCDVYVAIHSNAAAEMGAYATGCVGFYHPENDESKRLAKAFQEKLDSVCPIKSNRYDKIADGMKAFNGAGYGEIREPYKLKMTGVLIETNFHSYKPTAEWIVANISTIAQAIADVLVSFYNLKKKDSPIVTDSTKIYRVQVGSYSNKSNAEECQGKLKAQGYDGIIVNAIVNGSTVYRVQVGAFTVKDNADSCLTKLIKLEYTDAFIA